MSTETIGRTEVGRYGPFAIGVVTISLVVYPIAFNLGAYGQVLYQDIFQFVAAATAGLGVSVLASPYTGWRQWFTNIALGAPALWLMLAATLTDSTADAATDPILGPAALVIGVVSIPTVLVMLLEMFAPAVRSFASARLLCGGLVVVVLIAGAGFAMGRHNHRFLTCDDFKVAGSDEPANCAPV